MAQNITFLGASYSNVPAVELPKTGGGTASFTDVTDTTAAASDVAQGKYFHLATGERVQGTNSGGGGVDIPQFDVTWSDDQSSVVSVTCDKTYAECLSLLNNGDMRVAVCAHNESGTTYSYVSCSPVSMGTTYIKYVGYYVSNPSFDLQYNQDGTIQYISPSSAIKTAGTPTATKGAVSNHSVSVTPSVTNTTGYIEGGTKTGTAVTVSASELVSGSETKTANGTYDVTNLASLVVAIPIVTYYTSSSAPSSSQGSNGDIWLKTV